jgi:hypothetical protein
LPTTCAANVFICQKPLIFDGAPPFSFRQKEKCWLESHRKPGSAFSQNCLIKSNMLPLKATATAAISC